MEDMKTRQELLAELDACRKKLGMAEAENESFLRMLINIIPVGISILDNERNIVQSNPALDHILSLDETGMNDKIYKKRKYFRNDGTSMSVEEYPSYRSISENTPVCSVEMGFIKEDNSVVWTDVSAVPLPVKGAGAAVITVDITRRKQMEEELKRSEEKFRELVENLDDVIFTIAVDGTFTYLSPVTSSLLGYKPEELVGEHSSRIIHPEDLETVRHAFRDVLNGNLHPLEYRVIKKNGDVRWVRSSSHPVQDRGNLMGLQGIMADITERKQAEEKLTQLNQTQVEMIKNAVDDIHSKELIIMAQSRMAAMGEMLNNIAHQWRQPLNNLGLLIQTLIKKCELAGLEESSVMESREKMMNLVLYMSHTIDDFRNYFLPDRQKERFSLNESIKKTTTLMEASLFNHSINLKITAGKEVMAYGFPNEYGQVLLNIMKNAKDAILERKINAPLIRIELLKEKGSAVLLISDNAGGIANGLLDKIFEPYFTTKEMGTGIGLYMSKIIIEKNMGGRLVARNITGGAEFRVEIPEDPGKV